MHRTSVTVCQFPVRQIPVLQIQLSPIVRVPHFLSEEHTTAGDAALINWYSWTVAECYCEIKRSHGSRV